jgi:hypothetical protein
MCKFLVFSYTEVHGVPIAIGSTEGHRVYTNPLNLNFLRVYKPDEGIPLKADE